MHILPSLVLTLQTIILVVEAQSSNKWWNFKSEFKSECCRCVPFFGCTNKTINFHEKLSKHNVSNPVVNVDICPNITDYCCMLPNPNEECKDFPLGNMPPEVNMNPQPDVNCECTPWETCSLENIVTDGKGKTSESLREIGLISHSKCKGELDVCCFYQSRLSYRVHSHIEDSGIITPMESRGEECKCVSADLCSQSNVNGVGVIQPRVPNGGSDDNDDEICKGEHEVCCSVEFIKDLKIDSSSCRNLSNHLAVVLSLFPLIKFI